MAGVDSRSVAVRISAVLLLLILRLEHHRDHRQQCPAPRGNHEGLSLPAMHPLPAMNTQGVIVHR
jgi:hypothetical protein